MTKKQVLLTILICLVPLSAFSQGGGEEEIPPGMEVIQDGRIKIIVPVDAKRRQEGNLTVVETTDVYAARKFLEMEGRLAELETKEEELQKEIEQLKEVLEEIKSKLISQGKEEEQTTALSD